MLLCNKILFIAEIKAVDSSNTNFEEICCLSKFVPVKQIVSGRGGVYTVLLLEQKSTSFREYRQQVLKHESDIESVEERVNQFWKSIASGTTVGDKDPLYAADIPGSLFDLKCSSLLWNLSNLDNILKLLKESSVPGITDSMLYIGSWRAMFAYHIEDMNLYSINYLHCGSAKSWYSIAPKDSKRFENFVNSYFVEDYNACSEYLRHKTSMVSPKQLKSNAIDYQTALQLPGEYIITFPRAYHAGFNHGYNVAEATNFATEKWFLSGYAARICKCRPDSAFINVQYLETLYLRKKCRMKRRKRALTQRLIQRNSVDYDCAAAHDNVSDNSRDATRHRLATSHQQGTPISTLIDLSGDKRQDARSGDGKSDLTFEGVEAVAGLACREVKAVASRCDLDSSGHALTPDSVRCLCSCMSRKSSDSSRQVMASKWVTAFWEVSPQEREKRQLWSTLYRCTACDRYCHAYCIVSYMRDMDERERVCDRGENSRICDLCHDIESSLAYSSESTCSPAAPAASVWVPYTDEYWKAAEGSDVLRIESQVASQSATSPWFTDVGPEVYPSGKPTRSPIVGDDAVSRAISVGDPFPEHVNAAGVGRGRTCGEGRKGRGRKRMRSAPSEAVVAGERATGKG